MSVMFPIKNFLMVILLSFFTLQGCVKFDPPGEEAAPNKVVNKNSQEPFKFEILLISQHTITFFESNNELDFNSFKKDTSESTPK